MKIRSGQSLGDYVSSVITHARQSIVQESMKSDLRDKALEEKDKQDALFGGDQNAGGGDKKPNAGTQPAPEPSKNDQPSKTMADDVEALKGAVDAEQVIEKLNAIRSGKSFKDDGVKHAFEDYFNSLSDAERVALFAFVKGVSQIVTGQVPAQQATEPTDKPADIDIQKKADVSKKTRHIKPNIVKSTAPAPGKPKIVSKEEDTSAPVSAVKR